MSEVEADKFYPFDINHPPRGWTVSYIKDVVGEIRPGFASGKHNSIGHGIPHIRPMNIDRQGRLNLSEVKSVSEDNSLRLRRGDVLFNNTNSPALIGKTTAILRDDELAFSNHMTRLRLRNGHDPRFIAHQLHYLWSRGYFRHRCVNHVNQASISKTALANTVPLLLAPQDQQQRIVAKIEELFSDLDAGVAALERVQANLQRYRASVLKAAVEGRLTQQWRAEHPDVEPADELLQRILTQRKNNWQAAIQKKDNRNKWINGAMPTKGKYSDPNLNLPDNLPTLPNSWTWTTLDALTYFTVDYRGKTPPTAEEGIPIISAANVHGGEVVANRPRKVSEDTFWRWTVRGMPEPGDLLVTTEAPVAEVALYPSDQTYVLTRRVFACQTAGVDNRFIMHALRSEVAQQYIHRCLRGTTVPRILKPDLLATPIPLPPLAEQHQIADQIEAEYTRNEVVKNMCERGIIRSANLRQSILKRAFEGNLLNAETKTAAAG